MNSQIQQFWAFETILKAWNADKASTDLLLKAKGKLNSSLNSFPNNGSIHFGDTEHSSISVNELMDVIADNSNFQHYCDAIVQNQKGHILIIQRSSNDNFQGGKWCLPGGKAEKGEFLREAVKRELIEETGLLCEHDCNYSTLYRNPDGSFSHYFWCYVEDCEMVILDAEESQQYVWLNPIDIDNYDFMFDLVDRLKAIFNIPFKGKYLTEQELAALAVNKIEKPYTATSLETSYKKGCLMLDMPDDLKDKWNSEVQRKIEHEDIYNEVGFGRETEAHITVLYGFKLPEVTPDQIERMLPEQPVSFKIVDVSYFESEDYDVLKFGIESEQLHQLNSLFKSLPNENKYPDYKPHLTISYMKKGMAEKYIPILKDMVNRAFQSSKFDYSYNNVEGEKVKAHWDVKGYESVDDSGEDIQKSFDQDELSTAEYFDLLKAQQYQVGQISQKTGLKKVSPGVWVDPNTGKRVKTDENGTQQTAKKVDEKKDLTPEQLADFAKNSSQEDLEAVIKNSADPKLREAAHKELDRRLKEEALQKEKVKKEPENKELTEQEIKAVKNYTLSGYRTINRSLNKGLEIDEETREFIENISKALSKMPDYKGVVYRGISPIKDLEDHLSDFENNIGGEVEFPAYSSTSEDKSRGEEFGREILFEIKSKTGKSIKHLSKMSHENEVLFDKGSKFKIKKVKKKMVGNRLLSMNVILEQV